MFGRVGGDRLDYSIPRAGIPIPFPLLGTSRYWSMNRLLTVTLDATASMSDSKQSFSTFEELRSYVAETLGKLESLKSEHFPLTEDVLFRSGEPCAIYFCLHGPRQVRLSALWETEKNRILFYGSCGRRVGEAELAASPKLAA